MFIGWISMLSLGFVLGLKHAVEPDHAIAVSTIASESRSLWRSMLAGMYWGLGHTFTLFVVGMVFILMKAEVPEQWALTLEFLVGIMLVFWGMSSLLTSQNKVHSHVHNHHLDQQHSHVHSHFTALEHNHMHFKRAYYKSFGIGFIHGLAGSAGMVVLTMGTVHTVWEGGAYILIFGAGTITGMLLFTTLIGIPFVLSVKKKVFHSGLIRITGLASALFGLYYMYQVGIVDGFIR